MTTLAALLAPWQAAQDRCRAAYDQAPDAFAQALLHRWCNGCSQARHEQHPKEWYRW